MSVRDAAWQPRSVRLCQYSTPHSSIGFVSTGHSTAWRIRIGLSRVGKGRRKSRERGCEHWYKRIAGLSTGQGIAPYSILVPGIA
eukprot:2241999-Rhodomonas_salina.1